MTEVVLHGIIRKEFGESFRLNISSMKEVFQAIDANRPGFRKKMSDLSQQGMHYALIIDGKKIKTLNQIKKFSSVKKIDVVPAIIGSGPVAAAIAVSAAASIGTGLLGAAFAAGTIGAGTFIAGSLAIGIGSMLLMNLLAPKPPEPPSIETTTRALTESFTFSNKANLANQGIPVPVGYGRLMVGTSVIQFSTKNFPQSYKPSQAFRQGQDVNTLPSISDTQIFKDVEWPNEAPRDFNGWTDGMGIIGKSVMYYDPDPQNGNNLIVGNPYQPVSQAQIYGTVPIRIENDTQEPVEAWAIQKGEAGYTFPISAQYPAGQLEGLRSTIGKSPLLCGRLQPGETKVFTLGGNQWTNWYSEDAGIRALSQMQEPIADPYGELASRPNYRYRTPGKNQSRGVSDDYWDIFIVPQKATPQSLIGNGANVYTKFNILQEKTIILRSIIDFLWWFSPCGGSPYYSNSPFAAYRWPFGNCNGKFCQQNQDNRVMGFSTTNLFQEYKCGNYQAPATMERGINGHDTYAPCYCPPGMEGPLLNMNVNGGGERTEKEWTTVPGGLVWGNDRF